MAKCVLSVIVDTSNNDAVVAACMVHTSYAPCTHDGEPASPVALHSDEKPPGHDAAIGAWRIRTDGQRPLVLHRGDMTDGTHVLAEDCCCGPDVLPAVPS